MLARPRLDRPRESAREGNPSVAILHPVHNAKGADGQPGGENRCISRAPKAQRAKMWICVWLAGWLAGWLAYGAVASAAAAVCGWCVVGGGTHRVRNESTEGMDGHATKWGRERRHSLCT
jgi:hypothetical protein